MPAYQPRAICFTDFRCIPYTSLPDGVQYLAWGEEKCPTTAKQHYQAFAYGVKRSVKGWANLFGNSHVEPIRGTLFENEVYCSKQGALKELGQKPMQNGHKRTLLDYTDAILRDPKRVCVDIALDDPALAPVYVQYRNGLERLSAAAYARTIKGDHSAPEVIFIYGDAGTGKTRYVRELEPDIYDVPPSDGYKWKDGYTGQEAVLYDNIAPSTITSPGTFLKEIDRYPIQVPVKGAFVAWKPRRIYLTTTYKQSAFAQLFHQCEEFNRRITSVINLPTI